MKKRFYIFQNSFFAKNVKISGGDIRLVNILKRISANLDRQSYIFTSKEGYKFDRKKGVNLNFCISPLAFDCIGIYFCYLLRTIWSIFKIFFKNKKNVIFYSSSDFFPDTIAPFLFKTKDNLWVQIIYHLYLAPSKRKGNKIKNLAGYLAQRFSLFLIKLRADKIIIVDPFLKEELVNLGFNKKKVIISSIGINLDYFAALKDKDKEFSACFLGRLTSVKGVFDLISIWRKVVDVKHDAKLVVIGGGDGDVCKKMRQLIEKHRLNDNVKLLGFQEDSVVFDLLKMSKLFLFPSHEEGWGIAIAEAIACKLPVISWNLPVFKHVFENYTIQVKENAIDLFSIKVIELLENSEKRRKIANDGYNFIKRYSWDSVVQKELEIINL